MKIKTLLATAILAFSTASQADLYFGLAGYSPDVNFTEASIANGTNYGNSAFGTDDDIAGGIQAGFITNAYGLDLGVGIQSNKINYVAGRTATANADIATNKGLIGVEQAIVDNPASSVSDVATAEANIATLNGKNTNIYNAFKRGTDVNFVALRATKDVYSIDGWNAYAGGKLLIPAGNPSYISGSPVAQALVGVKKDQLSIGASIGQGAVNLDASFRF